MYKWFSKAADSFLKYLKDAKSSKTGIYPTCQQECDKVVIITTPERLIEEGRKLMREIAKKH